jgi:folate-binding protein YgfZ
MTFFYSPLQKAPLLRITGQDGITLLHRLCSADLRPLMHTHMCIPALFTTAQAKLIDWVRIFTCPQGLFVLASSPEHAQRLQAWINTYTITEDVQVCVTDNIFQCTVYGNNVPQVCGVSETPHAVSNLPHGVWFQDAQAYSNQWTGVVFEQHTSCANVLLTQGTQATASMLEERRIRACLPSHVYEYAEDINPLELRLGDTSVSWKKGCYIGQEVIARMDSYQKIARTLVVCQSTQPFQVGDKLQHEGKPLGRVTSAMQTADHTWIGLAVVKQEATFPLQATSSDGSMVFCGGQKSTF